MIREILGGISCDITRSTLSLALCLWYDSFGSMPTIVRISTIDAEYTTKLLREFPSHLRLTLRVDPAFADDSWAVGSETDIGFGSVGA